MPQIRAQLFISPAWATEAFTAKIGLRRYALYVFDYGAPVGFRLALAQPDRVTAEMALAFGTVAKIRNTTGP